LNRFREASIHPQTSSALQPARDSADILSYESPVAPQGSAAFPPSPIPNRFITFDLMRASAILIVLVGHVQFRMPDSTFGRSLLFALRQLGIAGVDIFYVLSGFLIGGALLTQHKAHGSIQLGRFLARRAWRLWPSYFLFVLFAWRWFHWIPFERDGTPVHPSSLSGMWPYLAHVQNYYDLLEHNRGATAGLQTWFLASIIHFYIFFSLLMALLSCFGGRSAMRAIPWIVAAIAIICLALRLRAAPVVEDEFDVYRHYFPTHLRLDEPMFGVLLAWLVVYHREPLNRFMRRAWIPILAVSVAALLPVALRKEEFPPFLTIWGYTAAALFAGGFTLTLWWREERALSAPIHAGPMDGESLSGLGWRMVRAVSIIGVWSYSIYLWHQPICTHWLEEKLRRLIGTHVVAWSSPLYYPLAALAYIAVSISIGAAMYYLLERPSIALRDRIMGKEEV
jgi:peptidoglycan/LPS O-acetylase OafA/YrhL